MRMIELRLQPETLEKWPMKGQLPSSYLSSSSLVDLGAFLWSLPPSKIHPKRVPLAFFSITHLQTGDFDI